MAEIQVIRADFRLIHGQVITKWIRQTPANKILIIDDILAKDSFMSSIYVMAAPPGIEVMIDTVDDAVTKWNSGAYGAAKLFVLIKDVPTIYRLYKAGFPVKELRDRRSGSRSWKEGCIWTDYSGWRGYEKTDGNA